MPDKDRLSECIAYEFGQPDQGTHIPYSLSLLNNVSFLLTFFKIDRSVEN